MQGTVKLIQRVFDIDVSQELGWIKGATFSVVADILSWGSDYFRVSIASWGF